MPANRPHIPIEVIIEITGRCRLICPYCTGMRTADVPLKDVLSTIDEAADFGVKAVRITGGEPLLHPNIQKILAYAKSKKLGVLLNTAAENMTQQVTRSIISNVDAALISLQGYNEQTNAAYTKSKNSFTDKIKNIFLLKSYLPTVWLATVITPKMAKSFDRFTALIKTINPSAWTLLRPIAEENEDTKQMNNQFYRKLTLQIMLARRENINVFIANPVPMCLTGDLTTGQQAFLGADFDDGHVRIVRSARGYFKPNYFIEENLGTSISQAWEHPYLKRLNRTDYLPEICQRCPVVRKCHGGSRAMALRAHGSVFAPDPLFDVTRAVKAVNQSSLILKNPRIETKQPLAPAD